MNPKAILNFDQLYSRICDNLRSTGKTDEILQDLKSASSDWNRVQIILKHNPEVIALFGRNIENNFVPKNETKSTEILKLGCEIKSVELINQALCLCPYNDDNAQLLLTLTDIRHPSTVKKFLEYQNERTPSQATNVASIFYARSKIFFDKGCYEYCINDILRSINFGHIKTYEMTFQMGASYKQLGLCNEAKQVLQQASQLLRLTLFDNETKSKETINLVNLLKEIKQIEKTKEEDIKEVKNETVLDHLNVFGGPNPVLQKCSNAIELRFNEERGRHVIAAKNIPPGSTLIVENPYAWSVSQKEYQFHCMFCLQSTLNGIPCQDCSSVMFCSETCFKKRSNSIECKILNLLDSSEKLGSMALLCFRTIAQTPLSVITQEFQKYSNTMKPPLDIILGLNKDGKLDSSNYSSVYAQTTNSDCRHAGDLLKRTYAAIYLTMCLRHIKYFGNEITYGKDSFNEDEKIIASVLLRHLQSASCNAYGINFVSEPDPDRSKPLEIDEIGGATYPIISTTNHSCSPNAYRFNIGKICVVKSLQEIPEGSEVLDSYGPLHTIAPLHQRREELENQYMFRCTCEACENDWPTFAEMRSPNYVNAYKCPNCHVGKLSGESGSKRKCLGCGRMTDFKKVQKLLKTAEEKYSRAKEAVLQQKNNSLDVEKAICNYILIIQKVLVTPCKEIVEAQEILKLHWNLWVRSGRFPRE